MTDKHTPFHAQHVAAGARLVSFAGYSMPLLYRSIQAEHRAVRTGVGLFDLSHMGEIFCSGSGATAFLQKLTTNDVTTLEPYGVQYTAMCYPEGGIVDDLLIYRLPDRYLLVVNAANIARDWEWLTEHQPDSVELTNASDTTGMLAIQGPHAEAVVRRMTDCNLEQIAYYQCALGRFGDHDMIFSRTGYTGEDGFEIYCPQTAAPELWDLAIKAGAPDQMQLVGLGARDSLRLEMRYALYGHEIDAQTNPIAAGMGWICKLDKGDFVGREAIRRMKQEGPTQKLVSLQLGPRVIPRPDYAVVAEGETIGTVRSGLFSPSLGCGIATAYVPRRYARAGTAVGLQVRDRIEPAQVVKPPFYTQGSRK